MEAPDYLRAFLDREGFEVESWINKSVWKDTSVLKVKKAGKSYLLKFLGKNAPTEIKSAFRRERSFYNSYASKVVPKLLLANEHVLILEYVEGVTLREYLITSENHREVIESLISGLTLLYTTYKGRRYETHQYSNAYQNISSLIQSGPLQSEKENIVYRLLNKGLAQLYKLRLSFRLKNLDQSLLLKGFSHGDLHYNNIIVSNSRQIIFLDFENYSINSFFDFDLLYLETMIKNHPSLNCHPNEVTEMFSTLYFNQNTRLSVIRNIFESAISLNPRFTDIKTGILSRIEKAVGKFQDKKPLQ